MKTKEEIEKLANKEYPVKRGGPMWMQNTDDNKRYYKQEGYIKGYTQCQLDMRKDWQNYTISEKADFIEFLNKQDKQDNEN